MNITELMLIYEDLFNPIIVVLVVLGFLFIQEINRKKLLHKARFYLIISFPIYLAIILYYSLFSTNIEFLEDIVISGAYLLSFGNIYIGYKKEVVNNVLFRYFLLLFIGSIPYFLISPFWNISGHILFVELPILFLISLNKRVLPIFLIPFIMLFNRPIVEAHTWTQAVFTFFFSFIIFYVYAYIKNRFLENKGR